MRRPGLNVLKFKDIFMDSFSFLRYYKLQTKLFNTQIRIINLPTLEERKKRGDLIKTYKLINGHYSCRSPGYSIFNFSPNIHLWGHPLQVLKERTGTNPTLHTTSLLIG